jgi:ribose 5-phosphate isomerase A
LIYSPDSIKQLLGFEAAKLIMPGMTVGIGTGSTAYWFVVALSERIKDGLDCRAIPTSIKTKKLAIEHNVPLIVLGEGDIDICVDGADEISRGLQVIKGGGGAMLQEKMVADSSRQFIVIADESKLVETLGRFPLPVEVIPYGWKETKKKIERTGCMQVTLRLRDNKVFMTDHGHYILDCDFREIPFPATLHSKLNNIPGVVENGLFINMADMAMIGYADGTVTKFSRSQ